MHIEETPLVSILIPAYNAEQWIHDAINSALQQTWPNREVIVVDDGSTDRTLEVARSLESNLLKIVSQPNSGASAARNRALGLAKGHYIQWLDADDILDLDKIELQLTKATRASSHLLSSAWAQYYFRPSKASFKNNALCQDLTPSTWLQTKMETNSWMAIESWLVPKHIADRAGPWNPRLSADDDGEYFARVVSSCEKIVYIPEARSRCRLSNPDSLSKGPRTRRWLESQLESLALQIEHLMAIDSSQRSRDAGCTLLQRWYGYFYPEHPDLMTKAECLASALGGCLFPPRINWKYRVIASIAGRSRSKRAQMLIPRLRARVMCKWDHLLHTLGI